MEAVLTAAGSNMEAVLTAAVSIMEAVSTAAGSNMEAVVTAETIGLWKDASFRIVRHLLDQGSSYLF